MALLVQKYGGTSVGTVERIKRVAEKICAAKRAANELVVVVSAMAGETNRLVGLAHEISELPDEREKDVLLASGEQVSVALLGLALKELGQPARSFLGHQVRIETDNAYGKARIRNIDSTKIVQSLQAGEIVVVAGFQGVDEDDNITTLGRGGSDTSAVALAAFLNAEACEIYTDVEGVFTTDPGICQEARKLARISYDEMIELASMGAKILEIRSVEFAKKFSVPVHVRSTFADSEGTWVVKEDESMDGVLVSGVSYDKNEAKITLLRVPDRPGLAAQIFGPIADAHIVVDMIIQNASEDGTTDLTFTVSKADHKKALIHRGKNFACGEREGDQGRSRYRQSLGGGCGDAHPRRCGGENVRGVGPGRDQHRDDFDLGDQDFRRHRREVYGTGGAGVAQSLYRK